MTSNAVICDVHPLTAAAVAAAAGGDKTRVQWVSVTTAIVWNPGVTVFDEARIRAAQDT